MWTYYDATKIRAKPIPRVRSVVVVAIPVVVDISEIRRRYNRTKPPVRTYKACPIRLFYHLFMRITFIIFIIFAFIFRLHKPIIGLSHTFD